MQKLELGFIGAGNMASAIIGGVLRQGLYTAGEIGVYDLSPAVQERYRSAGHPVFDAPEALVAACGIVVLAVKPQVFPQVLGEIRPAMTPETLLVSIAAGITAETIHAGVGFPCRLVLVMPNTPLLVGAGAAALSPVEPATRQDFEKAKALFAAAGIAEEIPADKMKEIIPVHGSSPAFIYLFAKTLVDCAREAGIDPDVANRLLCQTLIGSAKMMLESGKTHQQLIDMVCSPGGTTLAALDAMEQQGFSASIAAGFDACVRRAWELSQ